MLKVGITLHWHVLLKETCFSLVLVESCSIQLIIKITAIVFGFGLGFLLLFIYLFFKYRASVMLGMKNLCGE